MRPTLLCAVALLSIPVTAQKTEIRLDVGDPAGANFSSKPQMSCVGNNVYVAWNDTRDGASDIYFQKSTDAGRTWLAADVRLDTDAAGTQQSLTPVICCNGSTIYVVWSDFRNGGSLKADLYMNVSTDAGTTWLSSDVRIDQDALGAASSSGPQVACDAAGLYVVWLDGRNPPFPNIYFNRTLDFGATFLAADVYIPTNTAGSSIQTSADICCTGGKVYVGWNDFRNGAPDLYASRSLDGGATWLATDVRVNTDTAGLNSASFVSMCCEANNVYIAWWDSRNGSDDIYFNSSSDSGASYGVSDIRLYTDTAGAALSNWPEVACDNGRVYVVWEDWRDSVITTCPASVYFNYSVDSGATFQVSDTRLSRQPACAGGSLDHTPTLPQVVAGNGAVFCTWVDARSGLQDIYSNRSMDGGATWLLTDLRLDTDPAGAAFSTSPAICYDANNVYIAWEDDRNGATDIYFNIPFGLQEYGPGLAGSGGFVPLLEGTGFATIGSTWTMSNSNGLGGASGALLVGVTESSTPVLGGIINLVPFSSFPWAVGGALGVPGAGAISIPLSLPNDETFVGLPIFWQTVLLDPGAVGGVSMSNGLELRMG